MIDLGFDVDTLRIIDCDEDEDTNGNNYGSSAGASSIVNSLKRSSSEKASDDPSEGSNAPKIRADTNSTKLRSFLNNLDTQ